jgi:tripartite-type tricarboxylate transporter receptor subunit TctC
MMQAACALLIAASFTLAAQAAEDLPYPTKPIRMIVGSAPGGPIDVVARLAAQKLSEALGQSVVVDNRSGAGGTIGTEYVAKATADGYTVLMGSAATLCITPHLYSKLGYDTLRDFAPVSTLVTVSYALSVHPSLPVKSVGEFIALAKGKPGQLRFGSAGSGSVTHLAAEMFKSMAGIEVVHVPYRGAGPALIDLIAGQLDFMFDSVLTSAPHIRAGRLRPLAVSTLRRSAVMPELPTISEVALPGYEATTWYGLVAPAATPRVIIGKLYSALLKGLGTPEMREKLVSQGLEPVGNSPDEFSTLLRSELPKWGKVVKASGAKVD